jgi:hypothetical protein
MRLYGQHLGSTGIDIEAPQRKPGHWQCVCCPGNVGSLQQQQGAVHIRLACALKHLAHAGYQQQRMPCMCSCMNVILRSCLLPFDVVRMRRKRCAPEATTASAATGKQFILCIGFACNDSHLQLVSADSMAIGQISCTTQSQYTVRAILSARKLSNPRCVWVCALHESSLLWPQLHKMFLSVCNPPAAAVCCTAVPLSSGCILTGAYAVTVLTIPSFQSPAVPGPYLRCIAALNLLDF